MESKTKLISNLTRVALAFILLINFNFSFLISNSFSQWIQQNSGVTVNLYDVEFINQHTGWAVGVNGTVIKTTNAGDDWLFVANPTYGMGKILNSIHPVDSNVIYFVGAHSTLIKTTNGGVNWIEVRNGPWGSGLGFRGVFMLNKDTGWFCGGMRVLRTTDGCQTFDSAGIFWGSLADIYFKDYDTGLICGDGVVFKSTDGGMNWFNSNVPTHGYFYQFFKLAVVNNQYVWVAGGGNPPVYRSTNFANTWDSLTMIPNLGGSEGLEFVNTNTGFFGGSLKLYKTTDGGYNWIQENFGPPASTQVLDIEFVNDTTGWFSGGLGKIFHTTTGGQTNVMHLSNEIPEGYKLYQNYPNPFNNSTIIEFEINKRDLYSFEIFDVVGRKVDEIFKEVKAPGIYQVNYNGEYLNSGVYFYRLCSEKMFIIKKFLLIK